MSLAYRLAFRAVIPAILVSIPAAQGAENNWRKLPGLPGRAGAVRTITLDNDTLWAMAGMSVAYWEDGQWRIPPEQPLKAGTYLTKLLGGGNQPLYVTQAAGEKRENGKGLIYRLSKSDVEQVAEFPYEAAWLDPGIEVTPAGQIIQRTSDRLAVYRDGQWVTARKPDPIQQTRGPPKPGPLVFETKTELHFLYPDERRLIDIDRDGNLWDRRVPIQFPKHALPIRGLPWGEDRVLLFRSASKGFQGLSLTTGESIEVKGVQEKFGDHTAHDGFGTRDGSAWIVMRDDASREYFLVRVGASGECERVTGLIHDVWSHDHFLRNPRSVLEAKDGAVWLGIPHCGLTRIHDGQVTWHGAETGYDLTHCTQLVEDRAGNIYAAHYGGIYVRYAGEPPTDLPAPRTPEPAGTPKWVWRRDKNKESVLAAGWKVGPTIYGSLGQDALGKGPGMMALDASSGELRWQFKVEREGSGDPWLVGRPDSGLIEIATQMRIMRAKADGGELVGHVPLRRKTEVAPVRIEDSYLVVPPRELDMELKRMHSDQKAVWSCKLPGYVLVDPTVHGELCVVQTRGQSYGGQQTVCVDVDTGEIRWQQTTDAYGSGVAFLDDQSLLFETDCFMSPEFGEGWLICRDPQSGKERWRHRRSGSIRHSPLVDQESRTVYGVFGSDVVCLRCEDGSVVWKQTLSESTAADGLTGPNPQWSPHSLADGRMLVVDRNYVLHLLDAKTGEFQASVMLRHEGPTALPSEARLVAPPWLTADALIAAFTEGIVALPLPKARRGDE